MEGYVGLGLLIGGFFLVWFVLYVLFAVCFKFHDILKHLGRHIIFSAMVIAVVLILAFGAPIVDSPWFHEHILLGELVGIPPFAWHARFRGIYHNLWCTYNTEFPVSFFLGVPKALVTKCKSKISKVIGCVIGFPLGVLATLPCTLIVSGIVAVVVSFFTSGMGVQMLGLIIAAMVFSGGGSNCNRSHIYLMIG